MALNFKEINIPGTKPRRMTTTLQEYSLPDGSVQQVAEIKTLGTVQGRPIGLPSPNKIANVVHPRGELPPPPSPGDGLKRAVNYYADYAGCGWWRMIAPELLINLEQMGIINGLTSMVLDPRFYGGLECVRIQRQATPTQLSFVKFLKDVQKQLGFKIIYEIDDIIFKDDIPEFNRCKVAFVDDSILKSSVEMMQMCDEISVTCQFMKDYYIDKTGNKNVTVVPNYPAKMWMDGHYDEKRLMQNFDKNKKQPRIGMVISGTHIDVGNKTNQNDDYSAIAPYMIKTRKMFKWTFVGAFPLACKPFIDSGEMEFYTWFPLKELWRAYTDTNLNVAIAALQDCTFNRAKSNIKYVEASTCGVPGVFQDMVTYQESPLKFKTGDELIDQLKFVTLNSDRYREYSHKARKYAETMWLDDHIKEFAELYFTRIGSPDRKALLRLNPNQLEDKSLQNQLLHPKA